jgi:hypothetical protein
MHQLVGLSSQELFEKPLMALLELGTHINSALFSRLLNFLFNFFKLPWS